MKPPPQWPDQMLRTRQSHHSSMYKEYIHHMIENKPFFSPYQKQNVPNTLTNPNPDPLQRYMFILWLAVQIKTSVLISVKRTHGCS